MRLERLVETWGTVVVVDATSSGLDEVALANAIDEVQEFFFQVDRDFSTYKSDSQVSRLRRGEMEIADAGDYVQQVWALCEFSRELTLGAFDPWTVDGGFDPSGLVKGWAADVAAKMLVSAGVESVLINAAGDLALRGGYFDGVVKPWRIGVVNPENKNEIVQTFEITDGAIATSGTYERGAHINDPYTGLIAIGAQSATVVGPLGWLCDALATALMVAGADGAKYFAQPELAGYKPFVINRHENTSWSI